MGLGLSVAMIAAGCGVAEDEEALAHAAELESIELAATAAAVTGRKQLSGQAPTGLVASTGNLYWTSNFYEDGSNSSWSTLYRAGKDNLPGQEHALYSESVSGGGRVSFGDLVFARVADVWYAYFVVDYTGIAQPGSIIKRVPLAGPVPPPHTAPFVAILPVAAADASLETDGSFLYWSDGGAVRRVPIGGGAITTLATGNEIGDIGLDGSRVYYVDGQAVLSVAKTGGLAQLEALRLAPITALHVHVAAGATTLYFGDADGVVQSKRIGGGFTTVREDNGRVVTSISYDGQRVLWFECEQTSTGAWCSVLQKRGSSLVTTLASNRLPGSGMQSDATAVYWGDGLGLFKYVY